MTVSFTIPDWVFAALVVHLVIGAVLWLPLQFWAARFISPKRSALWYLRRNRWWTNLLAWVVTMPLWPWLIWDLSRDEWKHGLGKPWRQRIACRWGTSPGCCSSCRGTGTSRDIETNGRCWDCYGTGHAHA